jgi:hypothetical protein
MLDLTLATGIPVAVATIYDHVPGLRTALASFNDVILREAVARSLPVLDLRAVCTKTADYTSSSPIEPSSQGGRKIPAVIAELVLARECAASCTRVYGAGTSRS